MRLKVLSAVIIVLLSVFMFVSCINDPAETSSDTSSNQSSAVSDSNSFVAASDVSSAPTESSGEPLPGTSDIENSDNSTDETSPDESSETSLPFKPTDYSNIKDSDIESDSIDEFFNNSVFVGNSIMLHYYNYTTSKRNSIEDFLGNAKFFASASFSANNNLQPISDTSTHPIYKGDKMKIEDAVAAMGVKTVYFSGMALNDIALYSTGEGARKTIENMARIVDMMLAENPDLKIVFLANTHLIHSFSLKYVRLTNETISRFNQLMLEYCNDSGFDFVDIASPIVSNGSLADVFCTDPGDGGSGCHLTRNAYAIWTTVLREYAVKSNNGEYQNPDSMPLYSR